MDRKRFKLISTLMALLIFISPFSSSAMQLSTLENQSGHCQSLETDSQSAQNDNLDHASCTMGDCMDSCSSAQHCSSQAPIILTLLDTQNHLRAQGLAIDQVPDTHLSIPLSGLYRPPRV